MKVSELSGALLDYWTGRAERAAFVGRIVEYTDGKTYCVVPAGVCGENGWTDQRIYSPSSDWAVGGPIIERENGAIMRETFPSRVVYHAQMGNGVTRFMISGPTHLIAAMRAFVGSKFGAEVPDEVPA